MFDGFQTRELPGADGTTIHTRIKGDGPPLLLLHGYPQTHTIWHLIAPALAKDFTVVAADLRGYGDSSKPQGAPDHSNYSKRAMAADMVAVMRGLGFETFAVVGHDRGGRVAHRMALDHPDVITGLVVLDIVPTYTLFAETDKAFALGYYHWFFLAQPAPLPESLIGADPVFFMDTKMGHWSAKEAVFSDAAMAEYRRCFSDPRTIHASCEDYRAAATVDLEHDAADLNRKVICPTLALWGEFGLMHKTFDVLATWQERCHQLSGRVMPCGHFLPEEAPDQTLLEIRRFLGAK
ncbi:MAG: alpha/beta hydrolase [Rhodospirillales bacterium]|nr:alpha/beta hydrolase [Rhodospirillales bacterium]